MDRRSTWSKWVTPFVALGSVAVVSGAMALAQVSDESETPAKNKAKSPPAEREAASQPDRAAPRRSPDRSADSELPPDQPRRPAAAPDDRPQPANARRPEDRARPQDQGADETRRGEGDRANACADLGIEFNDQAEGGLTVQKIDQDSVAAQSGLRNGDVIVSVDGRSIRNPRQFQAYLSGQYGRRVPVIIDRGGQRYTVQFSMGEPSGDAAWLGVYLQEGEEGQQGAQITQVYPAGPAARAGMRTGDVIVRVNDQAIESTPDLISTVESLDPQSQAQFVVLRGDREVPLNVRLGRRDQFIYYGGQDDYGGGGDRSGYSDSDDDDFNNIPPYAMQLEHDRRVAEQHQRIEQELFQLREEVRKLREALQPNRPGRPAPQE
ncbi:MAG TPA: PDZ domain-containing protein [Pirellulaceae bacterium]|nr:PDZ domain-containing protein [Pirellulaceae bacterium]